MAKAPRPKANAKDKPNVASTADGRKSRATGKSPPASAKKSVASAPRKAAARKSAAKRSGSPRPAVQTASKSGRQRASAKTGSEAALTAAPSKSTARRGRKPAGSAPPASHSERRGDADDRRSKASAKQKPQSERRRGAQERRRNDSTPETAPLGQLLFGVDIAVRWRDLDAFNHVNNSCYFTFIEEARLQWLGQLAVPWLTETTAPVLAQADLGYRRPLTWPANVIVELRVGRIGRSSITLQHRIIDREEPATLYCEGNTVLVWIDRDSGLSAPLPDALRAICEAAA